MPVRFAGTDLEVKQLDVPWWGLEAVQKADALQGSVPPTWRIADSKLVLRFKIPEL